MIVRSTLLAAGAVVALATPALANPGVISQGETHTQHYDNNPTKDACIAMAQPYRVTLSHHPVSDTLTLRVGGLTATTTNGYASVTFWSGVCTSFDVVITGTSVAGKAVYYTNVYSGALAYEWSAAVA